MKKRKFQLASVLILSIFLLHSNGYSAVKDLFYNTEMVEYEPDKEQKPGKSYYREIYDDETGALQYDVEYKAGNLPIIISVPHGGYLIPEGTVISNTDGNQSPDRETQQIAIQLYDKIHKATGGYPHMVISRLHRKKLDMNRHWEQNGLNLECMSNTDKEFRTYKAWADYHYFIDMAKIKINGINKDGKGFFIDLHGTPGDGVIIGYGPSGSALRDWQANNYDDRLSGKTSIEHLTKLQYANDGPYDEEKSRQDLINDSFSNGLNNDGSTNLISFGSILSSKGDDFLCTPSINSQIPESNETYYGGAYNLYRHCGLGALLENILLYYSDEHLVTVREEFDDNGYDSSYNDSSGLSKISGIQLELGGDLRDNNKENTCIAITDSIVEYFTTNYNMNISNSVVNKTIELLNEDFDSSSSLSSWISDSGESTDWEIDNSYSSSGDSCAKASRNKDGYLTSGIINIAEKLQENNKTASDIQEIKISFNFRKSYLEEDDFNVKFGINGNFIELPLSTDGFGIEDEGANGSWVYYSYTIADSAYFDDNFDDFQLRFEADSLMNSIFYGYEVLRIDSVYITMTFKD